MRSYSAYFFVVSSDSRLSMRYLLYFSLGLGKVFSIFSLHCQHYLSLIHFIWWEMLVNTIVNFDYHQERVCNSY